MRAALEEYLKMAEYSSSSWRHLACTRFQKRGLPSRKEEPFHYLPLSQLYQEKLIYPPAPPSVTCAEIAAHLLPECAGQLLVFVNGQFQPTLSQREALPKQLVILPLKEALNAYGYFLKERLLRFVKEEQDSFALLNSALFDQGLFLYFPPNLRLKKPIQCLHFTIGQHVTLSTPRIQLFMGTGSEADWITQTIGSGSHLIADVTDLTLEKGARMRHWQLITPSKESWSFNAIRASLKRDCNYQLLSYTRGAKTVRQDYQFFLQGENSSVKMKCLADLSEQRQAHAFTLVNHGAPHTHSEQLYKQVLADFSQGSFQGKILVEPHAQKTEAYQLNHNLILGNRAQAYSMPNLEIFADDVKASHGATAAQLDERQLLYLKMRGLSEQEARSLLVNGFKREILSAIPFTTLLEKISYAY